jgi:hypothetical protein
MFVSNLGLEPVIILTAMNSLFSRMPISKTQLAAGHLHQQRQCIFLPSLPQAPDGPSLIIKELLRAMGF